MNKEVRKYVLFKRKLATIECAEECGNFANWTKLKRRRACLRLCL
jgi:hypothetical protein